jgi:hypothetical protein
MKCEFTEPPTRAEVEIPNAVEVAPVMPALPLLTITFARRNCSVVRPALDRVPTAATASLMFFTVPRCWGHPGSNVMCGLLWPQVWQHLALHKCSVGPSSSTSSSHVTTPDEALVS